MCGCLVCAYGITQHTAHESVLLAWCMLLNMPQLS